MNKRTYSIIGILAILTLAGFFLYATGFDPYAPEGSAKSKEAIREFIGDPHAVIIFEKSHRNVLGEPYDTYRGRNGDRFTVDPITGSVTGASFFSVPLTTVKKIYLQQAESSARAFAVHHYNDFYSRNMVLTESKERGYGYMQNYGVTGIEYGYTWSEQSLNRNTTNVVSVSTNSEGRVVSYYARDKTPPTAEPETIGKDQAIETATRYVIDTQKITTITHKSATVRPGFTPYRGRVIWIVDVEVRFIDPRHDMEIHRGGEVNIDAMTGELLDYNSCQ